jgi:hypothetical protein
MVCVFQAALRMRGRTVSAGARSISPRLVFDIQSLGLILFSGSLKTYFAHLSNREKENP